MACNRNDGQCDNRQSIVRLRMRGYTNTVNGPNNYSLPANVSPCPGSCTGHTQPPNCIQGCPCGGSPIIIDANGEGFHLTSLDKGVKFRIRDNTPLTQFSWTDPQFSNGWLALPRDGKVESLDELFGNFSPQPVSSSPNGFKALAYFASQQGCGTTDNPP